MKLFKPIALIGNVIFIFWILYNGLDEGFASINSVQAVSLIGLIFLLILNCVLLCRQK